MKAIQKWAKGPSNMGIVDLPEPTIGPDDVLLEVGACGICGSDLHIRKDEHEYRAPVVPGHEFSGIIIEKGRNVGAEWKVGDRVCGDLETMNGRIGVHVNGAYAEHMAIPERLLHHLPDTLSLEEGALIEQVTCMSHSLMHRSRIFPGDFVVITGPGPIGLTMLQMVRLYSPRAVLVTGLKTDTIRLAKAKELGADFTCFSEEDPVARVHELTKGVGADLVIDCSGGDEAIGQALRMVKEGGWITVIGVWGHPVKVNLDAVPYNNLTIRGGWGWGGMEIPDQAVRMAVGWHSWERALAIMSLGKVRLAPTITSRIGLEEWQEAFARLGAKKDIKVMIYPNKKHMPREAGRV
jgi:L-iditol 2-dehydrogenase